MAPCTFIRLKPCPNFFGQLFKRIGNKLILRP